MAGRSIFLPRRGGGPYLLAGLFLVALLLLSMSRGSSLGGADLAATQPQSPGALVSTPAVTVTATALPNPADAGELIAFNGTASGCGLGCTYAWVWGDGTTPTTSAVAHHTYYRSGNYSVTCWANGTFGPGSATLPVLVSPSLSVQASGSQDVADVSQDVALSARASGGTAPVTYQWHLGDGGRSSSATPTESFGSPGSYSNLVYANDSAGSSTHAWWNLTINPDPVLNAAARPTTLTAGEVGNFTTNLTGGSLPISYAWRFGDGTQATAPNVTHPFLAAGTYQVRVWANDSAGFDQVVAVNLTVLPGLAAIPTVSSDPTLVGTLLSFQGEVQGGVPPYVYGWTFGDRGSSLQQNATHSYGMTGTYPVNFWANDSSGHRAHGSLTVQVDAPLVVTPAATPSSSDTGVGENFSVSTNGGRAPYTVLWRFGDGSSAPGTSVTHHYALAGDYTAQVWVNDSAGAQAVASVTVTIHPALQLQAGATATITDARVVDQFIAAASGGTSPLSFAWWLDDGTRGSTANLSHAFIAAGQHHGEVWVNDSAGVTKTSRLLVIVAPLLAATPSSNSSTAHPGGLLSFTGNFTGGTGPYTFLWHLGDGSASTSPNLTHAYAQAGTYTVHFWVNDSVGQSASGLASVTILANPSPNPNPSTNALFLWIGLLIALLVGAAVLVMVGMRLRSQQAALRASFRGELSHAPLERTPTFLPPELADHTGEGEDVPPWPELQHPLTFFEGVDPTVLYRTAAQAKIDPDRLFILTVNDPTELEKEYDLRGATLWQVTRLQGDRRISPADIDRIADLAETHMKDNPGGAVLVGATESLLASSGLTTTVRFIHVLHEVAAAHEGVLIFFLNPRSVTVQERRSLEEGGRRVRFGPKPSVPPSPSSPHS